MGFHDNKNLRMSLILTAIFNMWYNSKFSSSCLNHTLDIGNWLESIGVRQILVKRDRNSLLF